MRLARCSTRCAPQLTLPASWDIAIAVAFVVGLLLYGIGTSMLRSTREPTPVIVTDQPSLVTWPCLVDESLSDAGPDLRLDLVERLSIIGQPWCVEILKQALVQENDASVKDAVGAALESWHQVRHF